MVKNLPVNAGDVRHVGPWGCKESDMTEHSTHTVDCSPPGSSVRGISQVKILERVAISRSRGPSRPRDLCLFHPLHWQADSSYYMYILYTKTLTVTACGGRCGPWQGQARG